MQPHGLQPARLLCPWTFPGKNTGVGCHFLLHTLTLYVKSGSIVIFTMLILPTHKNSIFLHLFRSLFLFPLVFCHFQHRKPTHVLWYLHLSISFFWVIFVVQLLSHMQFFATPWAAAHQASLPFTISQSLLKLMSIESMRPSHLLSPLSLLALNISQH